jgi:hypothetical protein
MPTWVYAQVGFNTERRLWFTDFYDSRAQIAGFWIGKSIELRDGTTYQYGWVDTGRFPDGSPNPNVPRDPLHHVREQFLAEHVQRVSMEDDHLTVEFQRGKEPTSEEPLPVPEGVAALDLAYSLTDGKGFIECVDAQDKVVSKLAGKLLVTENLTQKTVGTYPHIRLRTPIELVGGLVITGTACVVVGKPNGHG